MLLQKDLKKIFTNLVNHDVAYVRIGDSEVTIRIHDQATKLSLFASVFQGGNFIPKSVRESLVKKTPFQQPQVKTNFRVDEANYRVFLHYLGRIELLNHEKFKELLEEFGWLADEWRTFLEDRGKQDLVHVHSKK